MGILLLCFYWYNRYTECSDLIKSNSSDRRAFHFSNNFPIASRTAQISQQKLGIQFFWIYPDKGNAR